MRASPPPKLYPRCKSYAQNLAVVRAGGEMSWARPHSTQTCNPAPSAVPNPAGVPLPLIFCPSSPPPDSWPLLPSTMSLGLAGPCFFSTTIRLEIRPAPPSLDAEKLKMGPEPPLFLYGCSYVLRPIYFFLSLLVIIFDRVFQSRTKGPTEPTMRKK